MEWQPPDLNQMCPQNSNLTTCSYLGYYFLNFLARLFNEEDRNGKWSRSKKRGDSDEVYWEDDVVDDEEFDFIVVGAGTAGCVVANRLTEVEHWKVLLLEAGPEQPAVTLVPGVSNALQGSSVDYQYSSEPNGKSCLSRPGQRCVWPRGKMMGGSSSINTMVYAVGNRADYDGWAAMGNRGWSYEEILPYIRKYENNFGLPGLNRKYHGIHGPQYISRFPFIDEPSIILTEAFHQLGLPILDFNGAEQEGTMQAQVFAAGGMRISANTAYIEPIRRKRKNLTIRTDAQVIKVLIDESNKAYGVQYLKNFRIYTAKASKEVIVSCGTADSPKLLMLSGIGPKDHLESLGIPVVKDLPVGEIVQDHVSYTAYIVGFRNDSVTTVSFKRMLKLLEEYKEAVVKRGPIASTGPFNSVSFFRTDEGLEAPDIQIQTYNLMWREFVPQPSEYMSVDIFPSVFYDSVIPRVQNIVTKSRGTITLNATNPYEAPVIQANYLGDPRDAEVLKKGTRRILQLENTDIFKSGKAFFIKKTLPACNHLKWGSEDYTDCVIKHYTFALNHPVGSCRMGPSWDKKAVVDPRLRVYGVKGLRVIDASIIPTAPRGNTNSATTMVGEKGSDLIKEDWLHDDSFIVYIDALSNL